MQTIVTDTKNDPITAIIRSNQPRFEFHRELFATWLLEQNARAATVRNYCRAAEAWIAELNASAETSEIAWLRSAAPKAEKRLRGFASRKYQVFMKDVFKQEIDLGIPKKLPSCSRPNPQPYENGEIDAMLKESRTLFKKKHHTRIMVRIMIKTYDVLALRRGEVFGWDQVNFGRAEVTVYSKGGDIRILPIPTQLLRILRWWKRKSPVSPWTTERGAVKPDRLYRLFKRITGSLHLEKAKLHRLRHTRLTAMAATGEFDPISLAAYAGHRQFDSLRYYCKPQMERLRKLQQRSLDR